MLKSIRINFILLLIVFWGCSPNKIYEKKYKFDNYSWNRFNNLYFEVPINDIKSNYNFYLAIRHITQYPYRNLMLNLTINTPSGEIRSKEYDLRLRDKDGKLIGDGMGDLWDISFPLRKDFKFMILSNTKNKRKFK